MLAGDARAAVVFRAALRHLQESPDSVGRGWGTASTQLRTTHLLLPLLSRWLLFR